MPVSALKHYEREILVEDEYTELGSAFQTSNVRNKIFKSFYLSVFLHMAEIYW